MLRGGGLGLDALDATGSTALHVAAAEGRAGVAEWLLRQGADPGVCRVSDGLTPLMVAVEAQRGDVARVFAEFAAEVGVRGRAAGAEWVNTQDARGRTALHMAGREGDEDMFNVLMEVGARTDLRDASGRMPELRENKCTVM